jgi:hypothetical protein
MTNGETRMAKQILMPNDQGLQARLVIAVSSLIRHSCFVIRHWVHAPFKSETALKTMVTE